MSDFFMPTQQNNYWDEKKKELETEQQNTNNVQNDYWKKQAEPVLQKKQEHYENWNRYGVDVPDEYYDVFNKIISQASDPESAQEEAYKIGSAIKYSQMMGMPLEEAYANVDALNAAQFPDRQNQKGRFEAISDMFTMGKNNIKLGELGQKLMKAHREGDEELANSLMAEIDAINQQNVLMQDNAPRSWVMQALEAGAQSLPFTGAVAGAGIIGNFIAPAVGTGASFAASSYLSAGQEYLDMIANGSSPENARIVANVSGAIQGIIEADLGITKGIVKGSARLMGKETAKKLAENEAKKKLEEIGRNVFKRFHFGSGKKVLINYLENNVKDTLGEGTEEFLQEITSIVSKEVAAGLDGYDIPDDDFKSIVKQTGEAFKGGVLGALALGFVPAGLNAAADVKSYKAVKDFAEEIESEEQFKNAVKDNPVFEGMNETQKAEVLHDVWEKAQQRKEEIANAEARIIAEGRDAGEGAEEQTEAAEGEEPAAEPVARDESGKLYTQNEVTTDDDGNVTGGTFVVGDKTKESGNRYGYITYSTAENGDITIENFKMTGEREGLRGEVFDEFAKEHPDVKIEWNAIGSDMRAAKDALIEANPSGKKNGLNYYTTGELDNVAARKQVANEVRKNIHNVKRNADGSYSRTELSNKQVAAAVTLIESAAKRMNMGLSEYVSKTFGNQIFGSREDFAQATLAQGEDVDTKAGGMLQGTAQANWRQVGQEVKAVIYAGENADFSTWAHEMAHVFQNQLDGDLKAEAETAFNVINGDWRGSTYTFSDGRTMSSAEAFAYAFQDWLETGKAESEQMRNIFQEFAKFIADAYNRLRKHLNFTPEIESVFNKLLDGDDTIMSKALKAAEESEGEYRAMLKRNAEEKENAKKAAAEEAKKQAELEKEEASETTDFEGEKVNGPSAEELLAGIEEAENETENTTEESNAIDDALENTNLTDEKKAEIAEVLKDENSTRAEKAQAVTEAAASVYEESAIPDELFFQKTFEEAQKLYPNIVDISEAFNKKPEKKDVIAYLSGLLNKQTITFDKSAQFNYPKNTDGKKHVAKSSRYEYLEKKKNLDRKERHNAYAISAEDLIKNASYLETQENTKKDKKPDVLRYHHFIVPVYIDGHAWNVRVVGEEKKSGLARTEKLQPSTQGAAEKDNKVKLENLQVTLYDILENDMLFQIAGEIGAQNLDDAEVQEGVSRMQKLAIAKQMETEGKDAKAIRLATGWEKGADGKWRWEIDDRWFAVSDGFLPEFNPSTLTDEENERLTKLGEKLADYYVAGKEPLTEAEMKEYDHLRDEANFFARYYYDFENNKYKTPVELQHILKAPELYKAYPELKFVQFTIDEDLKEYGGFYSYKNNRIVLAPGSLNKASLLHEVQHVIQRIEGFARGGTADEFERNEEISELTRALSSFADYKKEDIENHIGQKGIEEYKALGLTDEQIKQMSPDIEGLGTREEIIERMIKNNGLDDTYREIQEARRLAKAAGKVEVDGRFYGSEFDAYMSMAGEAESRNVEKRMNFTPEQRLNTLLAATEDVAQKDQIILFQQVYHGSGADFDKFDTENFGLSGEGSMSFGYGTYVTDSEEIARDYAERQRKSDNALDIAYSMLEQNNFDKTIVEKELQEWIAQGTDIETYQKSLEYIQNNSVEDLKNKHKTNLYTVEIPDNGYIVWDKDVDTKTKKFVEDAVFEKLTTEPNEDGEYVYKGAERELREELQSTFEADINGEELYNDVVVYLGDEKAASKFLNKLGFAGINYPAYSNFGNAMGKSARNFVIFNDEDAKIVDKLLFQTQAELMDEARTFESWQEFMEYCEAFHADDEVSPIPSDSDAQWYQSFWEQSKGIETEQEKNEKAVEEKHTKEGILPNAVDALFSTYIRGNAQMVDDFLARAAEIDAIDLDSAEWAQAGNEEDAKERDHIDQLKDAISIVLSDYNWQTAMKRIQGGHEISEGLRKRLIGEMTDTFKVRDFRALYAELMDDEQYAVDVADSITTMLNKKLRKYHDIVKPGDDISRWSPEKRKRLAEQLQNKEIAAKIKNGSLKLDDELDAYIKSLEKQTKNIQDQLDELDKETKADYQRIADAERRRLLKLHDELLIARSKMKKSDAELKRKIEKGLKITEKYRRESQNMTANYDELFRKFSDLKNTIEITAEVQAALDRQEQVAGLRDDLNAKQKEKNLTAEVKKMRIQLVKRAMRRVPFNRIDYNNAKTVIAIQRMLEPNLIGGVNKFIGIDSPYLRGVISQIVTDNEFKEKILHYLSKNSKSSQAFMEFKKKLEELKSVKDFDSWTAKERKQAIKYLPKENWVKDLNLLQLAKEREESIDLDIGMQETERVKYDEKTGEPKTYKDAEGNEHTVKETAFRLSYSDEIGRMVQDAVGADMFDKIVNMPFSEWTTEDLEQLAQRIDELYTEGRDLLAAKNEARKRAADEWRKKVEDAIKETGITINDDDSPEERKKKMAKIAKIMGESSDIKGTEAGKTKGLGAKINRLLHSYSDMNVLRFARMLDGQSDGANVYLLYRKEDECYNNKMRSMNSRGETINKVMADNKITEGDLATSIKVDSFKTEFTIDELLYFLAADKDYVEDEAKVQRGLVGLDANDDYAATSRNAVMFGNMMSDSASQELKEKWAQLDKKMKDAITNGTLTAEQKNLLTLGQLEKNPGTKQYIEYCKAKWGTVLQVANNFLAENPKYNALLEAIEADYAAQYERMNEVSINEFNQPVHRVKAYVPLVRRESNGDTNEAQVKEDLLGAAGVGKQWADKGMTQRRVTMNPLHQKPVQTGLFRTWADSIERTEHFIAYAPYVRQLNAIYKSRDASYTRRFIEARYGKGALEYLDSYINEVANPNAGKVRERGAEWLHVLRGKTAPAYLGWKASGVIKQGLTSPWPYMQFVNPAEYMAAATKFWTNGKVRDAIEEKSVFMKNRRMDPINDLIDEMNDNAKTKLDRGWGKFTKMGMQGLEWIDYVCVAPGWLACYEKKYNQLQNASEARYQAKMEELKERNMTADIGTTEYLTPEKMDAMARKEVSEDIELEAVQYADDCTRQCQPSNRLTDLAPLFKNSSEAMKAFLQFQTSLNVIWQNIRYDMPYAVKQKQFWRIVGTVLGYVSAGIFMNSVMDGIGGDDDDDETQALRNLMYYSTTQFTDAVPMIGSELTNVMDKVITGKRAYSQSGTDMTPSATKILTALQSATSGNWQKAAGLTAEGIGLFLGAPVSGTKEIYKLMGKPLSEGDVNLKRGVSDVYGIAGDIMSE